MDLQAILPHDFYARKATEVARELLGKILVHKIGRITLAGRIVEAEAYLGQEDPCSHAFRGPTPRASIMFGPPGRAYVYFVYGNHFCFNVVTHDGCAPNGTQRGRGSGTTPNETQRGRPTGSASPYGGLTGSAGAVLIRALEPLAGIPEMMKRRQSENVKNLTNGPGKLTQALAITKLQNGCDLRRGDLLILDAPAPHERIVSSPRIGIRKAVEKRYRFTLKGNPFVSLPIPW